VPITSAAELEDLLGPPGVAAAHEGRPELHAIDVEWIARSPMVPVATSAADGTCEAVAGPDPLRTCASPWLCSGR